MNKFALKAGFICVALLLTSLVADKKAYALTANKVFFEFWPMKHMYRVRIHYTIPELKEAREARVEFRSKKKAEKYYFALLRGADFYLEDPKTIRFVNPALKQEPW